MPATDQSAGARRERHPILVIDDDPGVRQTVRWALEDEGFPVATAQNGKLGLESATSEQPAAVVLDMIMPVLGGDGFAAGLRRLYGTAVPILVLTADGHARQKAEQVGAVDYVKKPFNVDDLVHKVRNALGSNREGA